MVGKTSLPEGYGDAEKDCPDCGRHFNAMDKGELSVSFCRKCAVHHFGEPDKGSQRILEDEEGKILPFEY